MLLRCPVCSEFFQNDSDLYYHFLSFKSGVNDSHHIYLQKQQSLIYSMIKTNGNITRKQIYQELIKKEILPIENLIYFVQDKYFYNIGLANFYNVPWNVFHYFPSNECGMDHYRSIVLKSIPELLEKFGHKNKDMQCSLCNSKIDFVDGNRQNYLISNLNYFQYETHICERNIVRCNQTIMKEFQFDSCHYLLNYPGKCRIPHGHTYKLKVFIEKPVLMNDMVMDFGDISKIVKENVISKLDHQNINDVLGDLNSTSENISLWIWKTLEDAKLKGLSRLELSETPSSTSILTKEQLLKDDFYLLYLNYHIRYLERN